MGLDCHEEFQELKYKIQVSDPQREISEKIHIIKVLRYSIEIIFRKNIEIENCNAKAIIILGKESRELSDQIKKTKKN